MIRPGVCPLWDLCCVVDDLCYGPDCQLYGLVEECSGGSPRDRGRWEALLRLWESEHGSSGGAMGYPRNYDGGPLR